MNAKNAIFISSYPNEIEINTEQDSALMAYYKKELLEFYVTEKINKLTGKTESTVLEDFISLSTGEEESSFLNAVTEVRNKYGEYFSDNLNILEEE